MIKYRDGYDGQLAETFQIQLPPELWPDQDVVTEFINLTTGGLLTIKIGYAWDYASVPIFKWFSNWLQGDKSKLPSLVHDALCQLHRNGLLPMDPSRVHTDRFFRTLLTQRKFWKIRTRLWYKAVRLGSKHEQKPKKIRTAP